MLTSFEIIVLAVAIFFTSGLTTATGVGGGVMMLALMLQFMAPSAAIPVHGAVQSLANGWRLWLLREKMIWPIILRFALPMPFGIAIGLWFFQGLPKEWAQILIGCFIFFSLFSQHFNKINQKELPLWSFVPAGLVVGILNIVVGVAGPGFSTLLVGRNLSRQSIVSTISIFSFLGHTFKVAGFTLVGFNFFDYAWAIVAMLPSIVIGTYCGRYLLGKISDQVFKRLLRAVMAGLAIKLVIWDGLMGGIL